ncbi:MAG: DUF4197 domain-containing protein [Lentisphaeria bacterium]|nr:DUF4197 domain-containing protein [Lentisphaeria bacterium]
MNGKTTLRQGIYASMLAGMLLLAGGCANLGQVGDILNALSAGTGEALSLDKIIAGLKEALEVGTRNTVASTSKAGGYAKNPLIRIPMPEKLQKMASTLRKVGMGSYVDRFEAKMNQSAELAAREAAPVFFSAIKDMSFADAKAILQGESTAATDYFRGKTSTVLKARYQPIVTKQMEGLGAVKLYNDLETKYNKLPFVPKTTMSAEDYVTDQALKGLFTVLAQEEQKIRENPAARTTELLRSVFGGQK